MAPEDWAAGSQAWRGPYGPAGPAAARVLPPTGPADVYRRLRACSAPEPAAWGRFICAAAHAWAEWPLTGEGDQVSPWRRAAAEAPAHGVQCLPAVDRVLVAGAPADLRRWGGHLAASAPALRACGRWLAEGMTGTGSRADFPPPVQCGPYRLAFGHKTYVVGIVNRTRTSFSSERADLPTVEETVAAAWAALDGGADLVDIGAESTAERERGELSPEAECQRLLPVLEALGEFPAILSLDSRRPEVVAAALRQRPLLLNDVQALGAPGMAELAAAHGIPVVLMHGGQAPEGTGQQDVVAAVRAFLEAALRRAVRAGLKVEQLILDAGFGFGKDVAADLECTRRLGELRQLGRPLLHAPSRKHTIGQVLAFPEDIAPRLPGTAATVAVGIMAGADLVRVHDLPAMARVARMTDALMGRETWRAITAV